MPHAHNGASVQQKGEIEMMTLQQTVARAIELYNADPKKDLAYAAYKACEEGGNKWNNTRVHNDAHKQMFFSKV
jgi:hypothetical protein